MKSNNETAFLEILQIAQNEYDRQITREQGIENRAGIVIAITGIVAIFAFEFIKPRDLFIRIKELLDFLFWLKASAGVLSYISLALALIFSFQSITFKSEKVFKIEAITKDDIFSEKTDIVYNLIKNYQGIIKDLREQSNQRAMRLRIGMIAFIMSLAFIFIFQFI